MRLDDVTPATGVWPQGAAPAHRRGRSDLVARPGRRGFLAAAVAAGVGVGVTALGVFPSARPALAAGPGGRYGYRVFRGDCPSYASSHNCEPGCGPSPVIADACEPAGFYRGWFKNRPTEGYRLRPGQCLSGFDAWVWRYSGRCHACREVIEYRCHDGYKRAGGVWFNAICRHVNECDGVNPDLPTTYSPVGAVTAFTKLGPADYRIRGWAVDADQPRQAVPIRVLLDGREVARGPANRRSPEFPTLFWQYGRDHSFDLRVRGLPSGRHVLRVNALSLGRRGQNTELLRRTIRVP